MRRLATLWVGRLGPIEMASLHSFALQGQAPLVFSYTPIENLPAGVENRDAAEVYPSATIAHYRREGSPSLHSNFFRYALMRRTDHVWTDIDVIALRPWDLGRERLYGWVSATRVNCAVLRLPSDSPALAECLRYRPGFRGVAPQITGLRRAKYWVRTLGRGIPVEDWPWGSTGPLALTHFLRQTGEIDAALPVETFYPIRSDDARCYFEPGALSEGDFTEATWGVHLVASAVRRLAQAAHGGTAPPGSFLGDRIARARADGFWADGLDA